MKRYLIFLISILIFACSTNENKQSEQKIKIPKKEFRITKKYTQKEIKKFDSAELRIKRNEIFAQYGYKFKSPELKHFFSTKEWYKPRYKNVDSFLTITDKYNIKVLLEKTTMLEEIRIFNCKVFPNELSSFMFNSSILMTVDTLGKPNETYIDSDEICPFGQLHTWHINSKNISLIVLGDDYSQQVNLNAGSRLYAIREILSDKLIDIGINNILLGDTDELVKRKLECLVSKNPTFKLTRENPTSFGIEGHFIYNQLYQYYLSTTNAKFSFIIDTDNRLTAVIISTMNHRTAC